LTPKEILKTVEKLNTLLSIRLNLSEYDAIPVHFKNYTIQSGRVTFKVPGEYEVDLTIAEEDPEAQFWFIDFRFLFKPSAVALNPHVRFHIESKVNEALLKDGLIGCYKYLHELVLTHKIGEFKRQAINLARGSWVETLGVEPLNRSLCIQYWRNKHGKPSLTRSWFIMGVGSPRRQTGGPKSKATSHLFLRWFRDAKELENIELPFDTVNISTEILLKSIIAKHVAYILETTHDKLREKPLFAKRELGLSSYISLTEPAESFLKVQLTTEQTICIQIEPVTGRLVFSPASPTLTRWEHKVNRECKDLAGDAHKFIENLRFALVAEAISSRAITVGWERTAGPFLRKATLKDGLKSPSWLPADHSMAMWFRRPEWSEDWYLAAFPSMSGEHWLLIRMYVPSPPLVDSLLMWRHSARAPSLEDKTSHRTHTAAHNIPADPKIINYIQLPIRAASPDPSYSFLSTLNIFAAGIVSHYANLQALHSRRCAYMLRQGNPSRAIAFPSIYIRVEDIFPSKNKSARMGREWAKNVMRLTFQGIEVVRHSPESTERTTSGPSNSPTQLSIAPVPLAGDGQRNLLVPGRAQRNDNSLMVVEARMILLDAKGITSINEQVDQNIAFNSETGSFAFRLRQKVGESVIDELVKVGVRVERLVDFVKVLRDHEKSLKCDMVSLGKIAFTYGNMTSPKEVAATNVDHETSTYKATVDFSGAEKTMMLVLEKGNPHIRILDYLTKVLNSKEGLDGVATLLPQTLPVNRGLDSISKNWPLETGPDDNEMFVNVRAADWYIIRYVIRQLSPQDSKSQPTRRHFLFEIRLRHRRGEPWWYVHRTDNSRTKEADTLDEALKPLWTSSGSGWQGMRVSGVAQKGGIQELLEKLDEVMRRFALTEETIGEAIAAQVQAAANMPRQNPAPYSRQQQQPPPQRQQLQTTNQIQSQGRGRPVKQEIVEID
jgi:mediator of RNA polymerase II transcription subunit 14